MTELWTVWIEYQEPTCGCGACEVHEQRHKVMTVSARGMDEASAMARGVEIARGKGCAQAVATRAQRMGGAT